MSTTLPSCQILRKSIDIWYPNRRKTLKNYAYQNFQCYFLEVLETTDKDENGVFELALESWIEKIPILVQTTSFKIWHDLTWLWPDLHLRVTLSGPDHLMSTTIGFYE